MISLLFYYLFEANMFESFVETKNKFFEILFPDLRNGYFVYTTNLRKATYKTSAVIAISESTWNHNQLWFKPLIFKTNRSGKKSNGLGSWTLWMDIDDKAKLPPIPPTILVETKNGYHAYYRMEEFLTDLGEIEALNKQLAKISNGDACWDAVHYLRVPHTWHLKDPNDPYLVTIHSASGIIYTPELIKKLITLPRPCLDYLSTGASDDRSLSDYVLLSELFKLGLSGEKAVEVWRNSAGSTKLKERGDSYVKNVVKRSQRNASTGGVEPRRRQRRQNQRQNPSSSQREFIESHDGTHLVFLNARGDVSDRQHLCNFTATIQSVMIPNDPSAELVYTFKATHRQKYYTVNLPKSVFNARKNLNTELRSTPLMWYAGDMSLAYYFEYVNKVEAKHIQGVKSLGLHFDKSERPFYVFANGLLTIEGNETAFNDDPQTAHTCLHGDPTVLKGYDINYSVRDLNGPYNALGKLLTALNEPAISWSLLGWFTAALYKPWLYKRNYKFPILSFLGPAGSGKTTTIDLLMGVFGNSNPQSIVADTTTFSVLANLTATTTFPMNLSEVSNTTRVRSLRSLFLTLYDGARATRGRRDQTLNDYNLTTPVILDGNYLPLTDRAFIERTILLWAPPQASRTKQQELALSNVRGLQGDNSKGCGIFERCVEHALMSMVNGETTKQLNDIYQELLTIAPRSSERVVKNYAVVYFGITQFAEALGLQSPPVSLLKSLVDQSAAIGHTDDLTYFIEHVVDSAINSPKADIVVGDGILGFRLNAMYNEYVQRVKILPKNFSRDSLRLSLQGASYYVGTKRVLGLTYHVINLAEAQNQLNIPINGIKRQPLL